MNRILVIVIVLVLFLQLHLISRVYEPYPAILLPGGGGIIKDSDTISLNEHKLRAYRSDSAYILIDKSILLNTMPEHYRHYVVRNRLGLPVNERAENHTNSDRITEGKEWLRDRLNKITNWYQIHALELLVFEKKLYISGNNIDSIQVEGILSLAKINLNHEMD